MRFTTIGADPIYNAGYSKSDRILYCQRVLAAIAENPDEVQRAGLILGRDMQGYDSHVFVGDAAKELFVNW